MIAGAIIVSILLYALLGICTACIINDCDFLPHIEGSEAQSVALMVCGLVWPFLVLYGVLWCLYQLRYIYKPVYFIGVGFKDLYRQFRPSKPKPVYPSELPKARIVK